MALCPELDIASEGGSIEEARTNLIEALAPFIETASPSEVARRFAIPSSCLPSMRPTGFPSFRFCPCTVRSSIRPTARAWLCAPRGRPGAGLSVTCVFSVCCIDYQTYKDVMFDNPADGSGSVSDNAVFRPLLRVYLDFGVSLACTSELAVRSLAEQPGALSRIVSRTSSGSPDRCHIASCSCSPAPESFLRRARLPICETRGTHDR